MKNLILSGLFILFSSLTNAANFEDKVANKVLATIDGQIEITKLDLRNYAMTNPYLLPQLGIQGGPMRILDDLIKTRLLILEGHRIGQPHHGDQAGGDTGFAIAVRNRLAPRCDAATDEQALDYYQANLAQFSTPPYFRFSRYGLNFTQETRKKVESHLVILSQRLARGETSFTEISSTNEDEISKNKNGDIGFVADNDPQNPVMAQLRQAKIGEIIGPIQQGNMLFIYQITDHRKPIKADFESARKDAAAAQQADCTHQRTDTLFKELKERWKVRILVDDISVKPGEE